MSDPIPVERKFRSDLGTRVKSDNVMVFVETDEGLSGIGASLGNPAEVTAAINSELGPEIIGENPMFSERIYEKMYNGSR